MSIKRTIITTLVALALVAVAVPVVNAQTPTIAQLMAEIQQLQAQLTGLNGSSSTTTTGSATGYCVGITFTRTLNVGSTGSDVKCLQQIVGNTVTGTFGANTLAHVITFQKAHGIANGGGNVGPLTRAALTAALGTTSTTTTTTTTTGTTGPVSAMVASDTPMSGAVVNNQARAGLLNINFTGSGTVTSVTLQRSGISTSNTLSSVYLFDGATRLTSGYSFNTNGQLVINGLNIAVSGSHEISVVADVYSSATADSSSIAVAMVGFTANGTSVSSSVMGNSMAVVAGSAATANFPTGGTPTPGNSTINAGSVNQTLWSQNISISPRAVMLYGMTVKMIGSAPSNSLSNVSLFVDGTLTGTASINSNSQFVFAISNPVTLSTGSHLIEVHGDVVGGATRSFYISLEQGSDVALKDSQLGVFISPTSVGSTASNINGGTITLGGVIFGQSNVTVNQDASFSNTTTLVGGVANTTLASYKFTAYGEDTKVTSLTFTPTISGSDGTNALDTLSNVGLYVNGGQIGSNTNAKHNTALNFNNLGSQLLIPVGTTVTVSIKGDVIAASTNTVTAGANQNFASGTVEFDVASGATQGVSSGATSTISAAGGQQLTVSSTNVTFARSTGFAGSTVTPNSTVELGAWTLQTGSAEGVNVNTVVVTFPGAASTGANSLPFENQLSNLVVKVNGTPVGSPVGQPNATANNNFSVSIPVAINGSAEIELYGTIGSSSTAYNVTPSMDILYRGATSNLSKDYGAAAGVQSSSGAASIASAGITLSTSLTPQFVTGNPAGSASPLSIATFNVKSNGTAGATIRDITFTSATNSISSVTVNGITRSVALVSGVYTVTVPNVGIVVPSDNSGVNIPVTVQLTCIGSGCAGTSTSNVQLSLVELTYNNGSAVVCDGAGNAAVAACSNTSPSSSSAISAQTAALELVSSVPTVSMTTTNSQGAMVLGAQQIGTFTVAAGSTGDIKIDAIPFTVAIGGSTATITAGSIYLYDANGNVLANAPTNNPLSASGIFTFSPAFVITKGTSQTFTVYATIGGTLGTTTGASSVTFTLGAKDSFHFDDVTGAQQNIHGTNIYGYPNGTQSKTN